MRRKHRPKRQVKPRATFHGNAWAMPSAAATKAVYDTPTKRLLDRDPDVFTQNWIPAFAGMTSPGRLLRHARVGGHPEPPMA